jgi:hypothetical protein
MNRLQRWANTTGRFFAQVGGAVLQAVTHPRAMGQLLMLLNRTRVNYAREVDASANSIVTAWWKAWARFSVPVVSTTVTASLPTMKPALLRNQVPSSWM